MFSPTHLPMSPFIPSSMSQSHIPSHVSSFTQTQSTTNSEDDPEYLHLIFETSTGKIIIKCKLCENCFDNL
jgi:hypothetical protein